MVKVLQGSEGFLSLCWVLQKEQQRLVGTALAGRTTPLALPLAVPCTGREEVKLGQSESLSSLPLVF